MLALARRDAAARGPERAAGAPGARPRGGGGRRDTRRRRHGPPSARSCFPAIRAAIVGRHAAHVRAVPRRVRQRRPGRRATSRRDPHGSGLHLPARRTSSGRSRPRRSRRCCSRISFVLGAGDRTAPAPEGGRRMSAPPRPRSRRGPSTCRGRSAAPRARRRRRACASCTSACCCCCPSSGIVCTAFEPGCSTIVETFSAPGRAARVLPDRGDHGDHAGRHDVLRRDHRVGARPSALRRQVTARTRSSTCRSRCRRSRSGSPR